MVMYGGIAQIQSFQGLQKKRYIELAVKVYRVGG